MASDDSRPVRQRPVRFILSYLVAAGPVGDASWRWRPSTLMAFTGPGSVPFALLLFFSHTELLRNAYGIGWGVVIAAASSTAIVLARFRPFWSWLLVMAALVATAYGYAPTLSAAHGPYGFNVEPWPLSPPNMFALLIVQFALARDRRLRTSVAAWAGYVVVGIFFATGGGFTPARIEAQDNLLLMSLLSALVLVLGITVRVYRQGRARVAEEEAVAEAERTRRRVLEERARIARELHDIVAHHMSVITVQAQTAEYRLAGLPEEARAEFRSISEQARESLAEMRRLLSVLRGEDQAGPREPMPGPEGLEGLAEAVDRAGCPTTLAVGRLPEDLPESVALTVYRVAQEALSNVVRHAPGASARVEVRSDGEAVTVAVVNAAPPQGSAVPVPAGAGLGLVGMRERVALLGGSLAAEATGEGGFAVRARVPLGVEQDAKEGAR